MWLVLFLCFNTRFGFGFHYLQPFFIVNYVFNGYMAIENYSFNVCVLHLTWIIFSFPSILCKFIVSKWITVCHKDKLTIVASSTTLILLFSHGLTFIQFIFDFLFLANCSTTMPHALGPHNIVFVNNIFHI
jgi:hypothetical protein